MTLKHFAFGVALLAALPAYAHDAKGRHGGRVADAGLFHAELVTKNKAIEIFLTNESDGPIDAKGFKGVAIFSLGGKAERITLVPSEGGALIGEAAVVFPPNPKGAIQLTAPDGKTATARFD
jgi:hypothetical protein